MTFLWFWTNNIIYNFQRAFQYAMSFKETFREVKRQEGIQTVSNILSIENAMSFRYLILLEVQPQS